jgi:hypothetical protein
VLGRIRRQQRAAQIPNPVPDKPVTCALCGRPIPPAQRDEHHLVPRSWGGTTTVTLHRMCHRQVHALISERALAQNHATTEALLQHPGIQAFVRWVATKPPDLQERARKSRSRR